MPRKPRSFSDEQKFWYKKLKENGFDDIEYADGSLRAGIHNDTNIKPALTMQAIHEYYYMANHFLNNYKFKSKRDQIIWEYHANGLSFREIASALEKVKITVSHEWARQIILKHEKIMKNSTSWMSDYTPPENLQ